MMLKLNAAQLDALVLSPEAPEPIALPSGTLGFPINPMMFPHDWSLTLSVETRWQTDLVKSLSLHTDASVLQSRPTRKLTARFVGPDKKSSESIINSLKQGASSFGFPVPIFSDAAKIESAVGLTLYGSFDRRRFFVGGRAIIMPLEVDPAQSKTSCFYVRIVEAGPKAMVVALESFFQFRAISETDVIIPCIDCETVTEASGTALTDSVFAVEATWTEVAGASTLPAIWPPVSADDASALSPFCTILGNKALFPFDPDWSDGVSIGVTREANQDLLGRTQAQTPIGKPYYSFSITLVGYDRPRAWDISRFFDAVRGRAGLFYFEHPMRPWTVSSTHDDMSCSVTAASNQDVLKNINEVIITSSIGREVRFVDNVVETAPGVFRVYFTEAASTAFITDLQPVYTCRFGSDTLSVKWATNEVAVGMQFDIIEEVRDSAANRGDKVNAVGDLSYFDIYSGFSAVAGNTLLMMPGSECFNSEGVKAEIWPATRNRVDLWYDSSLPTRSRNESRVHRRHVMRALPNPSTSTTFLVQPLSNFRNNNKACLMNPAFSLESQVDQGIMLPGDSCLWSPTDGWTLFLCFTPFSWPATAVSTEVVGIQTPEIYVRLYLDRAGAVGNRAALSVAVPGGSASAVIPITADFSSLFLPVTVCVRFGGSLNGNSVHVWVNSEQALAASAVRSIPAPSSYTRSDWCKDLINSTTPTRASVSDAWTNTPMLNGIVSYKRALNIQELTDISGLLSRMFFTPTAEITLY